MEMTIKPFNGSERRAYVRLKKSLPVRFKISGNPTSQTYTAITKNISQGGLCLEIQHHKETLLEALSAADHKIGIDINTLIPQQNEAVSEISFWVSGRVDWARKSDQEHQVLQVGLEFEDLTEEARKRIRDYLVDQFLQRYPQRD
jgi:c-di-GMP-binding flagellar brake protein YcgR